MSLALFQDVDVARHRGQRQVEGRGQLADGGIPLREPREDGPASGVGESGEHGVERVLRHGDLYFAE